MKKIMKVFLALMLVITTTFSLASTACAGSTPQLFIDANSSDSYLLQNTKHTFSFSYYPQFENEQIILNVYKDSTSGKLVKSNTIDRINQYSDKKTITWTLDTTGLATGNYVLQYYVRFYSLFEWHEAPRSWGHNFTISANTCSANGHKWDAGTKLKTSTRTEHGLMKYTCTVCGQTKEETLPLVPTPTDNTAPQTIVYESTSSDTSIKKTIAAGIMTGTDKGFEPEKTLTRAEAATIILRMKGYSDEYIKANYNKASGFSDVSSNYWALPYINAAYEFGIVKGISATQFAPNNVVTVAEFETMIIRAIGAGDVVEASTSTWPVNYVNFANDNGISNNVNVIYTQTSTRQNAAIMIANSLEIPLWVNGAKDQSKNVLNTKLNITKQKVTVESVNIPTRKVNGISVNSTADLSSIVIGNTYEAFVKTSNGSIIELEGIWSDDESSTGTVIVQKNGKSIPASSYQSQYDETGFTKITNRDFRVIGTQAYVTLDVENISKYPISGELWIGGTYTWNVNSEGNFTEEIKVELEPGEKYSLVDHPFQAHAGYDDFVSKYYASFHMSHCLIGLDNQAKKLSRNDLSFSDEDLDDDILNDKFKYTVEIENESDCDKEVTLKITLLDKNAKELKSSSSSETIYEGDYEKFSITANYEWSDVAAVLVEVESVEDVRKNSHDDDEDDYWD